MPWLWVFVCAMIKRPWESRRTSDGCLLRGLVQTQSSQISHLYGVEAKAYHTWWHGPFGSTGTPEAGQPPRRRPGQFDLSPCSPGGGLRILGL